MYKKMKVSTAANRASQVTLYSHGEASIQLALCRMAQRITCVNNINLFSPQGYLGQRESLAPAQARYAQIMLENYTKLIYRSEDDPILENVIMEDKPVEYKYYIPIVPMILINGCDGIGTGFSTKIPKFNIYDIINKLRDRLLKKDEERQLNPWYIHYAANHLITKTTTFESEYIDYSDNGIKKKNNYEIFESLGLFDISKLSSDKIITIYDLPVPGKTYEKYYESLKILLSEGILSNLTTISSENEYMSPFVLTVSDSYYNKLIDIHDNNGNYVDEIIKQFKLKCRINTTNLILIDENNRLKKYKSIDDIFNEFYILRYKKYVERKEYHIKRMYDELILLNIKIQFINAVCSGKLDIKNVKTIDLINNIITIIPDSKLILKPDEYNINDKGDMILKDNAFKCLLGMNIKKVTVEARDKLTKEYELLHVAYEEYKLLTIEKMWIDELDKLECSIKKEYSK
jgi:DNA topoisomerase-2